MPKDYTPITAGEEPAAGLLGTWWRQPPHVVRKVEYAPYKEHDVRLVTVQADVLAATGDRTTFYSPREEPGLLTALLDVAQEKLKPVAFADRYGLLGYNYIVPQANRSKGGDPLAWFIAHARTALLVSDLILCLKEARESSGGRRNLANYLAEIPDGPFALGGWVGEIRLRTGSSNPILAATGILRYLLNANLGSTGRRLQSSERGLRTVFTFRALIEVVYWELADQVGQSEIHRCRECGRIFVHANKKASYCPPTGGQKTSRCKSRWLVREFRKRKDLKRRKR